MTLYGFNFLGPGTDVFFRLRKRKLPTSHLDALALLHDLGTAVNPEVADAEFIRLGYDVPGSLIPVKSIQLTSAYGKTYKPDISSAIYALNFLAKDTEYVKAMMHYQITPDYILKYIDLLNSTKSQRLQSKINDIKSESQQVAIRQKQIDNDLRYSVPGVNQSTVSAKSSIVNSHFLNDGQYEDLDDGFGVEKRHFVNEDLI